jgi:hypothetical protein
VKRLPFCLRLIRWYISGIPIWLKVTNTHVDRLERSNWLWNKPGSWREKTYRGE